MGFEHTLKQVVQLDITASLDSVEHLYCMDVLRVTLHTAVLQEFGKQLLVYMFRTSRS